MNHYEPQPIGPVAVPLEIEAVELEIVFIGPGPIAFSMTRQAALETARRIHMVLELGLTNEADD